MLVEEAAAEAARLQLKTAQRGGIRLASDPQPPDAGQAGPRDSSKSS